MAPFLFIRATRGIERRVPAVLSTPAGGARVPREGCLIDPSDPVLAKTKMLPFTVLQKFCTFSMFSTFSTSPTAETMESLNPTQTHATSVFPGPALTPFQDPSDGTRVSTDPRCARMIQTWYYFRPGAEKISETLCPPKPIELLIACLNSVERATFGT